LLGEGLGVGAIARKLGILLSSTHKVIKALRNQRREALDRGGEEVPIFDVPEEFLKV